MLFMERPIQGRDYSQWPYKPAGRWPIIDEYGVKLAEVSGKLYEPLSEGISMERDALTKSLGEIHGHLVVNHYPKCIQPDLAVGLKRHTDPSSMTMLLQDQVGGLQATKDDAKTWVTVRPIKNALVVNLGEHLYYISNGRYKRADHQAIVNGEHNRRSIALFFHGENGANLYPLNVKEGESPC